MARCTICDHAEINEINKSLAAGESGAAVARRYGLVPQTVNRHRRNHLDDDIEAARRQARLDAIEQVEADTIEDAIEAATALRESNEICRAIIARAVDNQNDDTTIRALGELRRWVELQQKLIGQLDERPVVNVLMSPQWIQIRTTLMDALRPFPDARVAAARALEEIDDGTE